MGETVGSDEGGNGVEDGLGVNVAGRAAVMTYKVGVSEIKPEGFERHPLEKNIKQMNRYKNIFLITNRF